ncbi:MAG: ABC transporter substrate-binding protein [Betaproteobacteria bacterium]|nr:MAG: ABC transporter substrate-binding protein [Betaproteobacteria bacterium]
MTRIKSLALAAALAACAAGVTQAQTAIKFTLDWRFEGPSAPYLWALEKGYYKAEGLDVTIDNGANSTEAINRVASGTYDMAFGDINSLVRFRDKKENAPIKAVAVIYNQPPFAIVSLAKKGIKKPKDLEGKVLGAPAADGAFAQWKGFVEANKIDASKVKVENVGFPVREPMLAEGKVDAITGFSFSSYINLRSRGVAQDGINVMLLADHGLDLYGNSIIVNPNFAAKNPKAVAGFVKATLRAVKEVAANQREAVKMVVKKNPIADEQWEAIRLKMAYDQNIITKEVLANGLGGVDMKRLTKSIDQIGQSFTFTNKPKADDIFDASFLPAKADRMVTK